MANSVDFSKKTFAVITGASQGIGREIAVELSRRLTSPSTLVLVARSLIGLNDTKAFISEINKFITVKICSMDLASPKIEDFEVIFEQNLSTPFELGLIFHNVGQVGTLNSAIELMDLQTWRDYYDLNVFSVAILNSVFVKEMRDIAEQLVVVNITSLCGSVPFKDMAMYGSGKAARDLYFKVFAFEEPDILVLNYSPGPVDTAMVEEVIQKMKNEETKAEFISLRRNKTILTTDQTVCKLFNILGRGEFKSGDKVDYFDRDF